MIDYELRRRRLKQLMAESGDTQNLDVAKRVGRQPAQVSHWITGEKNIGDRSASLLCNAYGKPAGWFDRTDDDSAGQDQSASPRQTPRTLKIMSVLNQLELEGKLDDESANWILATIDRLFRK